MASGKCPKCEKILTYIRAHPCSIKTPTGSSYKGVQHQCPYCFTILSAEVDPFALAVEVVKRIKSS